MTPNDRQLEAWNGGESVHYVRHADRSDRQFDEITQTLVARAAVGSEHRVLEVGCGCGGMTLMLAARAHEVVGLDFSEPMIGVASDRARRASVSNAEFVIADAQTHPLVQRHYDRVISQFGLMFFDEPVRAFSNLRSALRPSGQILFTTWQPLHDNEWLAPVVRSVEELGEVPELGGLARGPGMFALEARSDITAVLETAGFRDIAIESTNPVLVLGGGGTLDESADFLLDTGIVRGLMSGLDADARAVAAMRVRAELERHAEPGVGVVMEAGVWLVVAHP